MPKGGEGRKRNIFDYLPRAEEKYDKEFLKER